VSSYLYNRPPALSNRRELRHLETPEERFLWRFLRGKRFHEFKFFRQYSVGPFVLDFYCPTPGSPLNWMERSMTLKKKENMTKSELIF